MSGHRVYKGYISTGLTRVNYHFGDGCHLSSFGGNPGSKLILLHSGLTKGEPVYMLTARGCIFLIFFMENVLV